MMPDREQVDRWCEWGIVALLLGGLVYAVMALGAVRSTEFAVVAWAVVLALGLWLIRLWINPSHRFLLHPILAPFFAFVAYAAWRMTIAPVEYLARNEVWHLSIYWIALVLALHNLHRQETIQWLTAVVASLGTLLSFYALYQLASGSHKVWWFEKPIHYSGRGGATFINPNHLAGLLVTVMPLAAAQVFVGRTGALAKVFYGYAALAMLCGIGVTLSRGGWLAGTLCVVLLLLWLLRRPQYRIPAAVTILLIGTAGWFYFTQFDTARRRLEGTLQEGTANAGHSRKYLIPPTLAIFRDHWIWGAGPGQFDVVFPKYRPQSIQTAAGHAHNEYLELLADYGAVGAGILAFALGALVWSVSKTSKFVERGGTDFGFKASNRTAFFLGATIGTVALLAHCVVEFHWHVPGVALAGIVILAALASTVRFATDNFWLTPKLWSRFLVTLAAAGLMTWIIPESLRKFREGKYLNQAAQATEIDESLLALLQRAWAFDPKNPRTAFELGENLRLVSREGNLQWEQKARESVVWLRKATELNPMDPHAWLSLALCHHWLREREIATPLFEKALELGPRDILVANNVAWARLVRGDLKGAKSLSQLSMQWWPWGNAMAEQNLETLAKIEESKSSP